MARLNLPDGARARIFDAIVAQLRGNPTLQASGVDAWLAWEDLEGDNQSLDDVQGAAVRLTPELGAMAWRYAGAQSSALVVSIEASLPGMSGHDFLNLQDAIEAALYPDDNHAFEQSLVALGADTGLIRFVQPLTEAAATAGSDGQWRPMGTFEVDVLRNLS